MADTKVHTTILGSRRLASSREGNPRFTIITPLGNYKTQVNGAVGYLVDNFTPGFRRDPIAVTMTLSRSGTVTHIEPQKG